MQGGWAGEYRSRVDELLADESGEFPGMEAVVDVGDASAGIRRTGIVVSAG
jgi:hypothetical protein